MGNRTPSFRSISSSPAAASSRATLISSRNLDESNRAACEATQHSLLGSLEGEDGLRTLGFQFRFVPCSTHQALTDDRQTERFTDRWHGCRECLTRLFYVGSDGHGQHGHGLTDQHQDEDGNDGLATDQHVHSTGSSASNNSCVNSHKPNKHGLIPSDEESSHAMDSTTSQSPQTLHSSARITNAIMITNSNRKQYIHDGRHYDLVANLAQEAAHARMQRTFQLEWVIVCNDEKHHVTVKALVDGDHRLALEESQNKQVVDELLGVHRSNTEEEVLSSNFLHQSNHNHGISTSQPVNKPILFIATGRGKVRAGIFSRHHLLTSGIEVGTAWHNIREARMRDMGVVIIDPNARGENEGMETFKRSVHRLFLKATEKHTIVKNIPNAHPPQSVYILAHSASGGHLVRHLREDPSLLPFIRAIAFTDSTHNIQWCKEDPILMNFLETANCVYLRSNDVRSSQSCVHVSSRGKDIHVCSCRNCVDIRKNAGVMAETDSFWEHRFGKIRTLWAGTADHALSNWAGHEEIWSHFDRHYANDKGKSVIVK